MPENRRALDLACGLGGNSILLAQQGLKVEAWDIADVPIAALQDTALKRRLFIQVDVEMLLQIHPFQKHLISLL